MLCHITDNLLKNQCETVFLGTLILVSHKNGSFFPISAAESTKIPKDKIGICSKNVIPKEVLAKSSHLSMVCSLSLKMRKMGKWRTKEDVAGLKNCICCFQYLKVMFLREMKDLRDASSPSVDPSAHRKRCQWNGENWKAGLKISSNWSYLMMNLNLWFKSSSVCLEEVRREIQ